MIYIIDANNLAGQLKILGQENFDKSLIEIITRWLVGKKHKIYLVFDGVDFMGDKKRIGNLNIVYTPRDNYYKSADDKIVELAATLPLASTEPAVIVTDDRGIIDKINELKLKSELTNRLSISLASKLAIILKNYLSFEDLEQDEETRNITDAQADKINKELLKLWK